MGKQRFCSVLRRSTGSLPIILIAAVGIVAFIGLSAFGCNYSHPLASNKTRLVSAATDTTDRQENQPTVAMTMHVTQSRPPADGWLLLDEEGKPVYPGSMTAAGNDLFFLQPDKLWRVDNGIALLKGKQGILTLKSAGPDATKIGGIPFQEFSNLVFAPARGAVVILDKSGDLFEYFPQTKQWRLLRPNYPLGSPDPEYIDFAANGKNVCLLDPERNQIWRYPSTADRYFKEVMPWRLKPGDISVADGIGIAIDGDTFVLRKSGQISKFSADPDRGMARRIPFKVHIPARMRPSKFVTAPGAPLFIVERENNRVIVLSKQTGKGQPYNFSGASDLRGVLPEKQGFWVLDRNQLLFRSLEKYDDWKTKPVARRVDERLSGLTMPLKNASLPMHPGVWAGARRLYRFGIHKGTDFFNDPGRGTNILMDTPVYAADDGRIVRADCAFQDMNAATYGRVIRECKQQHFCAEPNENLLRGCQVWLDHGNGLVTRYAHLDKARPNLKVGAKVSRGDLLGYVGVSGTGENLAGRSKHPHLHFEVWLDGKYLGWGLTPSETIGVYEDIFGTVSKKGG